MAIYNEILVGRFARAIQKIFGVKGGVPTRQVSGEIMPVFNMDDMMALEHRALLGVRSFARSTGVAAGGAGNTSGYRLRNPAGSNVVAIMEKIQFFNAASSQNTVNRGGAVADFATSDSGNEVVRDFRMSSAHSALILSSSTAAVVNGAGIANVIFPVNATVDVILFDQQEVVIAPGDQLSLYGTVNTALDFSIMWRERAFEESEFFV